MQKEKIILEVPAQALHVEHAHCPQGHSLMDPSVVIKGYASVKVILQYGSIRGSVLLDPIYGSFHNIYDVDIPEGVIVDMFCPTCNVSMKTEHNHCDYCFSPTFELYLPNGGILEGCLKAGCHQHKLKLVDVDEQLGMIHGQDQIQLLM